MRLDPRFGPLTDQKGNMEVGAFFADAPVGSNARQDDGKGDFGKIRAGIRGLDLAAAPPLVESLHDDVDEDEVGGFVADPLVFLDEDSAKNVDTRVAVNANQDNDNDDEASSIDSEADADDATDAASDRFFFAEWEDQSMATFKRYGS